MSSSSDPADAVDPADPIEDLVGRALLELEQRGEQGLQEFLVRHASRADAVRQGLERLRQLGILAPPPPEPPERETFGEFRVVRRLGAGGMGVVYAAVQTSLQRTVAVKVVRPEFLLSPSARERFRREVDAIARLQHPGIVPILAVGNDDVRPWFAMEYVDGPSLEDVLAQVRGKDPARLGGGHLRSQLGRGSGGGSASEEVFTGTWWEVCVRLVRQVATTMAYVHEQGIVHRDLKPSNIVVTQLGQALVLDFGLAHVRDLHRVTQDAGAIGTPAYTAPEQLRGEAVDERVDVYGLGVTLYELLTTHLPFEQQSPTALQAAIRAGDARPVRTWNRAVPRELEILCAVAIDRDRARRYRSMAAFAQDLDNVLARRPILARSPGVGLRFLRFAQRHPTATTAVVALLLVALQFPLLLWRHEARTNQQLARLNAELERSNRELDRQRAVAVDTFTDALDAVRQAMVVSAQNELQTTPGGEQTQLAILRRADALYDRLRAKRPDNRRVEFDSARNLQHIGQQSARLGDSAEAERAFRAALDRIERWRGADFQYLRGGICRMLALVLARRGDQAGAAAAHEQAWCELEAALPHFPGDRTVWRQYVDALSSLAAVRQRTDRAEAERLLLIAQREGEAMYAELPQDTGGAIVCALQCNRLADHFARSDPAAAEQWATRGIEVLAPLRPAGPEEATMRAQLASLYESRGVLRESAGRPEDASMDHQVAYAVRAGLVADYPALVAHHFELACSCNNLAMAARHLGGPAAALDHYGEAVEHFRQALRMAPKRVDFARGLQTALTNRVELLFELDDRAAIEPAIGELAAAGAAAEIQLAAARLVVRLMRRWRDRDGASAADVVAALRSRAIDFVEAAIAAGGVDRAHFEHSRDLRAYDELRDEPRFLDALDRLR